ncbi:MAG: hypothetical protein PHV98_00765 [Candidatus Omnitrophica bacterium]|nr:hypothetical protein [Candidatus Omnitrophota bacterium]
MTSVSFQNRLFADVLMPRLRYVVKNYNKRAQWGCNSATIEAYGEKNALFDLVEYLRCGVTIHDDWHSPQYWGFINEITIYWDNVSFSVSLDTMSNNIAVAYTTDGIRYTTAWSEDTDSSDTYGEKQLLVSASDRTETDALQLRDAKLQALKYPIPKTRISNSYKNRAIIQCKPWINTLDWRYYQNLSGKESYEEFGSGGREIGEDDRPIAAMSFQIAAAAAWDATLLKLHCYKYPSDAPPADNLIGAIYSDSGSDTPNALLASATVAAANIPTSSDWVDFVLSSAVTLNPGTKYWIRVARSGAVDEDAYYMVRTNLESGYPRGGTKLYNINLSAWVDEGGRWGDMNFILQGDLSTTGQISALITAIGEFFAGAVIVDASGVETCQYRNGDNTGLYELLKLMDIGTTNDRRMLCEISADRYLRVYEEPAKPSKSEDAYKLDAKGNLYDKYGKKVNPSECIVGVWCSAQDVIPDSVELSKIANSSPFFIEEAQYNAESRVYAIMKTKDVSDVWDIGGIEDL